MTESTLTCARSYQPELPGVLFSRTRTSRGQTERPQNSTEYVLLKLLRDLRRVYPGAFVLILRIPHVFAMPKRRVEHAPLAMHPAPRDRVVPRRGLVRVFVLLREQQFFE